MSRRPERPENQIQRALTNWLGTPFRFDPNVTPSDLLVSLLRGGEAGETDGTLLDLLIEVLPKLRGGLRPESADFTARLLYETLKLDAAAVTSNDRILAFVGRGADHHRAGSRSLTALARRALSEGEVVRTRDRAMIGCPRPDCPLSSAVIAPLLVRGNVVGALKFFIAADRPFGERDERIAAGLARVFGVYLELAELDARSALVTRAELEALRAQIAPHFLFNTLTTIAALTRSDPDRAHDLIVDFAEFFRESLSNRRELIPLREELQYVERYLRFEQARFGERLSVGYEVAPVALDALVPALSVQPLVENALIHGIAPRDTGGSLHISAHPAADGIEISVLDDGVGVHDLALREMDDRIGMGVALNNINLRLVGHFGPGSRLEIKAALGGGTIARFWVPATRTRQEP